MVGVAGRPGQGQAAQQVGAGPALQVREVKEAARNSTPQTASPSSGDLQSAGYKVAGVLGLCCVVAGLHHTSGVGIQHHHLMQSQTGITTAVVSLQRHSLFLNKILFLMLS